MKIAAINNSPAQKQQSFEGQTGTKYSKNLRKLLEARFGSQRAAELLDSPEAQKLDKVVQQACIKKGDEKIEPWINIYTTPENPDTFTIVAMELGKIRELEMKPSDLVDHRNPFDVIRLNIEKVVAWLGRSDKFVEQEKTAMAFETFERNPQTTAQAELLAERHMTAQE